MNFAIKHGKIEAREGEATNSKDHQHFQNQEEYRM